MKKNIPLILLLVSFTIPSSGQVLKTRLDFVGGVSAREYIHAGIRYQYTDFTQVGLCYGGDVGIKPEIITTWSVDHMIHFGSVSFNTNRPAWYARQGFTYSSNNETDRIYKYSYINVAAGREFGINNWLGVNFDMGFILQVMEKTDYKAAGYPDRYRNAWFWLPLVRAQVFISL